MADQPEPTFHISVTAKGGAALDILRTLVALADRVEVLSVVRAEDGVDEEAPDLTPHAPSPDPGPNPYVEPTEDKPWGRCDTCGVILKRGSHGGSWVHMETPIGLVHHPESLARFMTREGAEAWDGMPSGYPWLHARTAPPHPSGS